MPSSNIDHISATNVKAALRAIRYAKSMAGDPLLELSLVQRGLREEGLADSARNRAWMLGRCLDAAIRQRLAALRGQADPVEDDRPDASAELEGLDADYLSGNLDLEAWSMLYARYLGASQVPGSELAGRLGITTKTITRRLERGHKLLADHLRELELDAQRALARMPGAAPADRIRVDPESPAAGAGSGDAPPASAVYAASSGDASPNKMPTQHDSADETAVVRSAAADPTPVEAGVERTLRELLAAVRSEDRALRLTGAQAAALAAHRPRNLRELRLLRIAEWSRPRYRLDERFVGLTLLVDRGERAISGRWEAQEERHTGLHGLLDAVEAPALVLLGPPGAGKSTLLRRLELETAIRSLRQEEDRCCLLVSLSQFRPARPGDPLPAPGEWLAQRWAASADALEPLEALLRGGRMLLLLDALNEIPSSSPAELAEAIRLWKDWLQALATQHPGNRVVFACRSLDYSQPLSTPTLRVPQIRIEGLTDEQVRAFLECHRPDQAEGLWATLAGSPQLELLRSPYFLELLVEQVGDAGEIPAGRAALFTGFVRQALRREVELGNRRFLLDALLTERDRLQLARWRWSSDWNLPERGALLPALARLAEGMQHRGAEGERAQVRLDVDDALEMIDRPEAETILRAGESLALLDEDPAADEVMFVHQLVQEYFAARAFVRAPDPGRLERPWRADRVQPPLEAVVDGLDPADPLPPLPATGWEETLCMAAAMADAPEAFLDAVVAVNLALAGRAAGEEDVRARLSDEWLEGLREALVVRSRDPEADLRERIACGQALGQLGDPRLTPTAEGADAPLLPSTVTFEAAQRSIGSDEPIEWTGGHSEGHMPRHAVDLERHGLARLVVTNAEWARFMRDGGYEDEAWWEGEVGRAWRRGENTAAGLHAGVRHWLTTFRQRPDLLREFYDSGAWDEAIYRRWRGRLEMTEADFDAHLTELYPGGPLREPRFWRDPRFDAPAQPVVGICWHEARAYCAWLSARSGRRFRLPSEAEWEAAARGAEGRVYAWGQRYAPFACNGTDSHLRRPAPVGVFPDADTPEGLCDMTGNVWEWTSSAWGLDVDRADFGYPYRADDGREAVGRDADLRRVARGGAWTDDAGNLQAAFREGLHPASRDANLGLRVAESLAD